MMLGTGGGYRVRCVALSLGAVALACGGGGCASKGSLAVQSGEGVGAVVRRVPEPEFRRLSRLVDFEVESDGLFVSSEAGAIKPDAVRARTGQASGLIPAGTKRVTVKASSLLSGRDFPGAWTLLGGYLYAAEPLGVSVRLEGEGGRLLAARKVALAAGEWTPVMVDLASLRQASEAPAGAVGSEGTGEMRLLFEFDEPLRAGAWCDDVMLADNTRTFVAASEGVGGKPCWTVERKGLSVVGDQPLRFKFSLPTEDVPGGWRVEEASRTRVRFTSTDGKVRSLAIYADGRSYWDGRYKSLAAVSPAAAAMEAQHQRPAQASVPEEQGRVDRNTPGDANHDGYNETDGAYRVVAMGRRVEVKMSPRSGQLVRPVVEVAGLPAGDVRVTVEGQLVEDVLRLADGQVLVVVPNVVQRATVVNFRVQ